MLKGFSAAAWQRTSTTSLLAFLGTGILMVGFAIASNNGAGVKNVALVFYGIFVLARLTAAVSGAVSIYKARREYRHGYTTLQSFSKFGMYYRALPRIEPGSRALPRLRGPPSGHSAINIHGMFSLARKFTGVQEKMKCGRPG
ncbi:hypothetical protein AHiyo1_24780 [Arthrobacter sp. Hiyo1]|uniref:hypothetical protein n=1 Tax=Arthrobacter sp. Hiyo1 TaxID=1588020 RepID=UPI0006A3DBE0|nr:hypothetical protein [Arthrobacter sp. Hiyo1]GAP59227.1 hypothetical protein AHiyo1_24780 [Arthrobacter sp. Hiyo1]